MARYAIYDKTTGEVKTDYLGPHPELQLWQTNLDFVEYAEDGHDLTNHYVVNGELVERPKMPTWWSSISIPADGVTPAILADLPPGVETLITTPEGAENIYTTVDDGIIEYKTVIEGDAEVKLYNWPYKDIRQIITVLPVGSMGLDKVPMKMTAGAFSFDANPAQELIPFIPDESLSSDKTQTYFNTYPWLHIDIEQNPAQELKSKLLPRCTTSLVEVSNMAQHLSPYLFNETINTISFITNYAQLLTSVEYHYNRVDMVLNVNEQQFLTPTSFTTRVNDIRINANLQQVLEPTLMKMIVPELSITLNVAQLLIPGYFTTLPSSLNDEINTTLI